ncbi:MAG: hypothetical protein KGR26_13895, partial [Cyanobacteria bacterium REEB65]|nr:hypothetical protein [Cyanobacteria bacterium REEB65]
MKRSHPYWWQGFAMAALALAAKAPAALASIPEVSLLSGGEIGPSQSSPIVAAATSYGHAVVARSEAERLVLYELVPLPPPHVATPSSAVLPAASAAMPSSANPFVSFLPPLGPASASPSPTPAPPAFRPSEVAADDVDVDQLAMAANAQRIVLSLSGHDDSGTAIYGRTWRIKGWKAGGRVVLERGPGRVDRVAAALAKDGNACFAWSDRLGRRPELIETRQWKADGQLGATQVMARHDAALDDPAVASARHGFMLAFRESPRSAASASNIPDAVVALHLDDPPRSVAKPLQAVAVGLDHPTLVARSDGFQLFWTDPAAEGRALRLRAISSSAWKGPERDLRTDLHPTLAHPYEVAPVGADRWLVVWSQFEYPQGEDPQGSPMVVEGRLYHPFDYAISPPLLLGESDNPIDLRGLVPAGNNTWIALW